MSSARPERGAEDDRLRRPVELRATGLEPARRELVNRIVHSQTFGRSERLGALLTYICEMTLQGRASELNEQQIGQAVFDRRQDYDSAADGIVRSQASRLRQRLELYFQQEGAGEPLRIVIPRGGYVPVFEPQGTPETPSGVKATDPPSEKSSSAPPQRIDLRKYPFLRGWGLSLVLALMLVALWLHDRWPHAALIVAAPPHLFWSHVFTKNETTMVVAPDSGLVLFHGLSGRDISLEEYLEGAYRSELNGPPEIGPAAARKDWLLDLANRRYTSMVDLQAILTLKDRARTLGSDVSVRYARDLRPNDFKTGTVVLLGASSANPWVELFERNMNFLLKDDFTKYFWVVNRNPQKGEPPRWQTARTDPQRHVFGLVAYMPNLAGDGNALILEGTSMSGTEAATDFVADDRQLLPFLIRIRRPDGTLPHFELLLETENMGASAAQSQVLGWRTMN